jgi:hypothetical protein
MSSADDAPANTDETGKISMPQSKDADTTIELIKRILELTTEEQVKLLQHLDGAQSKKKRIYDRKTYLMMVDYSINGHYYRDFLQDISLTGVFIKTSNEFSVGQKLSLSFLSPDHQKPLKLGGEIVRSFPDGIGIQFSRITRPQADIIRSIMDKIKEE